MNNVVALPISSNAEARLPQKYEAARTAIAECERIDECKDWADKAAAMAAYARMSKDDSLKVLAIRIQARALRRIGQLQDQIPRGDTATRYGQVGDHPPVTRSKAAADAGLSEHQRKTALRVAAIPEAEFERQVESASPPTVTKLAEQGKTERDVAAGGAPWSAITCPETRDACETLERFARFCQRVEPTGISRAVNADEAEKVRQFIEIADQWFDRLVAGLAAEF
jgi:hypothetical protein